MQWVRPVNYLISGITIIISSGLLVIALMDDRSLEEGAIIVVILATLLFSGYTLYRPSGLKSTISAVSVGFLIMFFIVVVAHQIGAYSLMPVFILTQILASVVIRQKETERHS